MKHQRQILRIAAVTLGAFLVSSSAQARVFYMESVDETETAQSKLCDGLDLSVRSDALNCLEALIDNDMIQVPAFSGEEAVAAMIDQGASEAVARATVETNLDLLGISTIDRSQMEFQEGCNNLGGTYRSWDGAGASCWVRDSYGNCQEHNWFPGGHESTWSSSSGNCN